MGAYEVVETSQVSGVEIKITNADGSWLTHDFPAKTIGEANNALNAISAILFEGQQISATIY